MQKININDWIDKISKPQKNIGGHSICPFAKKAKYKIISTDLDNIIIDFPHGYELVIFVSDTEKQYTPKFLQKICDNLNCKYKKFIFLYNSKSERTYINNIRTDNDKYDMIFCQPKEELNKARDILSKTSYYEFWDKSYLNKILKIK
jgi:hypothetical protein